MTIKKKDRELLEDLVRAFYFNDSQMKKYKAVSEEEKSQIKDIMKENELTDFAVSGVKVKYVESRKEELDEDKLLEILKKNGLTNCVKTVEVVDMDALENAIYHREVPNSVLKKMDSCKTTKVTVALRVSKVNEKVEG